MKIKRFLNDSGFIVTGMAIVKLVDCSNSVEGWIMLFCGFIMYMVGNCCFSNNKGEL